MESHCSAKRPLTQWTKREKDTKGYDSDWSPAPVVVLVWVPDLSHRALPWKSGTQAGRLGSHHAFEGKIGDSCFVLLKKGRRFDSAMSC